MNHEGIAGNERGWRDLGEFLEMAPILVGRRGSLSRNGITDYEGWG
jgi:hypothetical protein